MDGTSTETTHDLLLDMAGRVDDELLAWARELVAVGETQHALDLLGATLVADRAELPPPTRAALVGAARSVRTELDLDRSLPAAPAAADRGGHRFDADPVPALDAAVQALPARLLVGCRVLLARRLTPAGSAPGPLPCPVLLVEVSPGARDRDVLAYQLGDALGRAGVRAAVEVIAAGQPLPAYHVEAMRVARPMRSGDAAGGPAAADRAVGGGRQEPLPGGGRPAAQHPAGPDRIDERPPSDPADRAEPQPADRPHAGQRPADRLPPARRAAEVPPATPRPSDPGLSDPAQSDPAQSEPDQSEPDQSEPAQSEPAQSEPAQSEPAQSEPAPTDQQPPDGPSPAGEDDRDHRPFEPLPIEGRPGPRPIPADRGPRPTGSRGVPHPHQAPAAVRLVPPSGEPADDPALSAAGGSGSEPALAGLSDRGGDEPVSGSGLFEQAGRELPRRERRHRYLIERPGTGFARDAADATTAGPTAGVARTAAGNTQPLPVQRPADLPSADPHPDDWDRVDRDREWAERDRADWDRAGRDRADWEAGPVRAESGPGHPAAAPDPAPGDLGLRPESVARLSESGREMLARLQAELHGGGPQLGQRAGGLGPNGGGNGNGNGTGPHATVDPPDLAG